MNNELPSGWFSTTLRDLFEIKYGKGLPQEKRNYDGDVPVYGSNGVVGKHNMSITHGCTIIIGRKGSVGEVHISSIPCWPIDTTYFIDEFRAEMPPTYWMYFLKSLKLGQQDKSSAIPGINRDDIYSIEVPVPPLPEQRRIAAKLEKLLGKVDACKKRLERIPIILKRFRQSVLAAACSGRLTEDWRVDDSYENDLPAGWSKVELSELLPKGGIFDGPFGSNLKTSDYADTGVRVIRLENVGHLKFNNEKTSYISLDKYRTLTKHTVREGEIIFASFIDEEIRACVIPEIDTTAIAKADCFCIRPNLNLVVRQYLVYQLVSRESYDLLFEQIHGATRPRINTTQLRKLKIKVCPLAEQNEIVRRVESLFSLADQIEARYQKAKSYVDKLTQSILARAVRGELVSQDLNDEPASSLLDRIQYEKAGQPEPNIRLKSGKRTSDLV